VQDATTCVFTPRPVVTASTSNVPTDVTTITSIGLSAATPCPKITFHRSNATTPDAAEPSLPRVASGSHLHATDDATVVPVASGHPSAVFPPSGRVMLDAVWSSQSACAPRMRVSSLVDLILMKLLRIKQIEDNQGNTLVSEGIDANFLDIVNYGVFAMIQLDQ
jgi:hypothetical protein